VKLVLARTDALRHIHWLNRSIWQFPIDAWILQEVVSAMRPELIVETGTRRGGSAFYFATLLDLLDTPGEVISIDIAAEQKIPLAQGCGV
jgi:cephalosporin hydroxylase